MDLRSQLGFMILMVDKESRANVLHYGSKRPKLVTRSTIEAEIHPLMLGFHAFYVLQKLMAKVIGQNMKTIEIGDFKKLLDVVKSDRNTDEQRLQIELFSIKDRYEKGKYRVYDV